MIQGVIYLCRRSVRWEINRCAFPEQERAYTDFIANCQPREAEHLPGADDDVDRDPGAQRKYETFVELIALDKQLLVCNTRLAELEHANHRELIDAGLLAEIRALPHEVSAIDSSTFVAQRSNTLQNISGILRTSQSIESRVCRARHCPSECGHYLCGQNEQTFSSDRHGPRRQLEIHLGIRPPIEIEDVIRAKHIRSHLRHAGFDCAENRRSWSVTH